MLSAPKRVAKKLLCMNPEPSATTKEDSQGEADNSRTLNAYFLLKTSLTL